MEPWRKQYEHGRVTSTRNSKVLRSVLSAIVSSTLLTIAYHGSLARPASTSSIQLAFTSGSQLLINQLAHCANLHFDLQHLHFDSPHVKLIQVQNKFNLTHMCTYESEGDLKDLERTNIAHLWKTFLIIVGSPTVGGYYLLCSCQ